ncbi:MAG: hypothetical protein DMG27_04740 [Acidobacteria bacterium]|nr:MAG: hypothetical protein DMG27_04740 [Acidobacteriota bacterium]
MSKAKRGIERSHRREPEAGRNPDRRQHESKALATPSRWKDSGGNREHYGELRSLWQAYSKLVHARLARRV